MGSFSGKIIIINSDTYNISKELNGSKDKILSLKWHPFFEYIIASGSADNTVRVWDTKNVIYFWIISQEDGHKVLDHHKSRVRSVYWNSEIPWMLFSGGDDSVLAIWDIRTNTMISDVYEPCISTSSFT